MGSFDVPLDDERTQLEAFIDEHRSRWNKDARQPGAERDLTGSALARLVALHLVRMLPSGVLPLPALCRYRPTIVEAEPTLL